MNIKEDVLKIEIVKVNDNYSAWWITYQNEDVFPRGEFRDKELNVYSDCQPDFDFINDNLYLRGEDRQYDSIPVGIGNNFVYDLRRRVDYINEKYGISKRWRSEYNDVYYYIESTCKVNKDKDFQYDTDNERYEAGNYFKTREEAEAKALQIKEILKVQ